jgi:hypothetical protein
MTRTEGIKNSSGEVFATFIPADVSIQGIEFYTDPEMDFQLGAMRRPRGHEVEPHVHSSAERELLTKLAGLSLKNCVTWKDVNTKISRNDWTGVAVFEHFK